MIRPNPLPIVSAQGILACCLLILTSACQPEPPEPTPPYTLELDMQELMGHVLDPAADIIWGSAGAIITAEGERDLAPTDDEGWERVANGAATIIESANLLMLPGRAVDDGDWREFSLGMVTMGNRALVAADAHDAEALFAAGADLYQVCLACHQQYDRDIQTYQPGGEPQPDGA